MSKQLVIHLDVEDDWFTYRDETGHNRRIAGWAVAEVLKSAAGCVDSRLVGLPFGSENYPDTGFLFGGPGKPHKVGVWRLE